MTSPEVEQCQYGRWESPISVEHMSSGLTSLNEVEVHSSSGTICIVEGRPSENGRCVVTSYPRGSPPLWHDAILPTEHNARSKVHEYGGAACTVNSRGPAELIYTDWNSNGVFSVPIYSDSDAHASTTAPRCILQGSPSIRYADFDIHPRMERYFLAVQESHRDTEAVKNCVVLVDRDLKTATVVVQGADFYAHPRWSSDGSRVCWVQWMHPDMPWTGSQLYVAECEWSNQSSEDNNIKINLREKRYIAGVAGIESICQPRWAEDGELFFVSDRTGWWQMYVVNLATAGKDVCPTQRVRHLKLGGLEDAEFGCRELVLGSSTYACLGPDRMVAVVTQNATSRVVLINPFTEEWQDLGLGLVEVPNKGLKRLSNHEFVVIGATTTAPMGVYIVSLPFPTSKTATQDSVRATKILIKSSFAQPLPLEDPCVSMPECLSFPRVDDPTSTFQGLSYCVFFPPRNPSYTRPDGVAELPPPLIVSIHGGPSAHVSPAFKLATQYWTGRGYAFVAVNYTGSTGYGRAYREALNGHWGFLEIVDVVSCVRFLAAANRIDEERVGLVGASAGGYSVLQALCAHPDMWAGAVCQYGIGDLKSLANTMHKFEKFYIQQLLFGPGRRLTNEDKEKGKGNEDENKLYHERSPCFHADRIRVPLMLLQGREDKVVPLSQARTMMESIVQNAGSMVDLTIFEGEGHGWVKKTTIEMAIKKETGWWEKTLLS